MAVHPPIRPSIAIAPTRRTILTKTLLGVQDERKSIGLKASTQHYQDRIVSFSSSFLPDSS